MPFPSWPRGLGRGGGGTSATGWLAGRGRGDRSSRSIFRKLARRPRGSRRLCANGRGGRGPQSWKESARASQMLQGSSAARTVLQKRLMVLETGLAFALCATALGLVLYKRAWYRQPRQAHLHVAPPCPRADGGRSVLDRSLRCWP
eukprot:scaffold6691_cov358-Prasinococcus_capsulatus_cf.AAC.3